MSRAAVLIDIRTVWLITDHISPCPKRIKHTLSNSRCASVCAVQSDFHIFKRTCSQGNQITNIAVSASHKVYRAPNIASRCQRQLFYLSIQICLNLRLHFGFQFISHPVDYLDSVVIKWVMARRNHDSAVKSLGTHHIGNAGRSRHMQQIRVRARSRQPCHQGILKHVAAPSCILPNYNLGFVVPSVIPSEETPHLKGMFHRQIYICFSSKSVCSKIFSHNNLQSALPGTVLPMNYMPSVHIFYSILPVPQKNNRLRRISGCSK